MTSTAEGETAQPGNRTGADDPVLMSKITVPGPPDWAVRRPRIEKLIAEGAQGPLTVVSGPPGAGKTVAIALWAAATSYPCSLAWISLDSYDNQPRAFWSHVAAALRLRRASKSRGFPRSRAAGPFSTMYSCCGWCRRWPCRTRRW